MSKRLIRIPKVRPITIGCYTLHATGVRIDGRPSFQEHEGVGDFIQRAHQASGFWLADWLRYGDSRADWQDKIEQVIEARGIAAKTAKNIRAVGKMEASRRRDDADFSLHETVAGLPPDQQSYWLEEAVSKGWNQRELRMNIRADRRRKIIEGQAILEGFYRVVYADPPWIYGNRPPSGSGAQSHYPGMTIEAMAKLPVAAHTYRDAVMFMWVTAPMLYENPGPRELIEAWGFTPKTGLVWDKVGHVFGNYVSIRHEHLIICTRGSCTPDRPTPMFDSVITERQEGEHSSKPASFRKMIERLYDGPYVELFGREPVEGWDVFGNDAALWEAATA